MMPEKKKLYIYIFFLGKQESSLKSNEHNHNTEYLTGRKPSRKDPSYLKPPKYNIVNMPNTKILILQKI